MCFAKRPLKSATRVSIYRPTVFHYFYVICTTGIGDTMIMLASLVSIQFYFDKRRPLANGVALSGVGFGMMVLPPFYRFLLDRYEILMIHKLTRGKYTIYQSKCNQCEPLWVISVSRARSLGVSFTK